MRHVFVAVLALSCIWAFGCTTTDHYSGSTAKEDWNSLQQDPVCGKSINPKETSWREAYDGRTYYFENEACWRRFHDNPTAYVPGDRERRTEVREVR